MQAIAGIPFADLPTLLTHKIDLERYWWLYAMLFSTAVPTVLHLGLACLSLQALLPLAWRERICGLITRAQEGVALDGFLATLVVGSYVAAAIAVPLLTLWGLGIVLWSWALGPFLIAYQSILVDLFLWIAG